MQQSTWWGHHKQINTSFEVFTAVILKSRDVFWSMTPRAVVVGQNPGDFNFIQINNHKLFLGYTMQNWVRLIFVILYYEGVSKSFRTESITKYTLTFGITRCCHLETVMVAKLTRLTNKIAIQLYLVAQSSTICGSRSRRPVRKRLDTPSYFLYEIFNVCVCACWKVPKQQSFQISVNINGKYPSPDRFQLIFWPTRHSQAFIGADG
jgi:hypothetical protein